MLVVEKIKENVKSLVKEHAFSLGLFLLATIIWALSIETPLWGEGKSSLDLVFGIIYKTLMGVSLGALLAEAVNLYYAQEKSDYNPKNVKCIVFFAAIMLVSLAATLQYVMISNLGSIKRAMGDSYKIGSGISNNVFIVYLVTYVMLSLYFFYKKSKESFETYVAKAFCGIMKAQLVSGIISSGITLIILAFNVLIIDTDNIDLLERVLIILLGLVEVPCVVVGLTETKNKISKFGKVVLSYVFPALLTVAFAIIYVYILKIVISFKLPSNEVFSILTALFAFGICIWTMAQGSCDEALAKPLRILPWLFIPFIVLQIMCLYMRVSNYGYTTSRYLGLALIIFEILYFALYIFNFFREKRNMAPVIFMIIAAAYLILLIPGTNMYSVITNSQKGKIEKYISLGSDATNQQGAMAYEAYRTIAKEGGLEGDRFIKKNLTKEQIDKMNQMTGLNTGNDSFFISAHREVSSLDVSGCNEVIIINTVALDSSTDIDPANYQLSFKNTQELIGTVDISDIVKKLIENEENSNDSYGENMKVISQDVEISEGGTLIITDMYVEGNRADDRIESLEIEGYVIR